MGRPAIALHSVGKRYRLGPGDGTRSYTALRDVIATRLRQLVARRPRTVAPNGDGEFWALRDVTFEVTPGESIGIIGANGAGKSTLLKVLSRITEPTEGWVRVAGRVASLLEVGTGFHPELTGRENIYLNGAILGMTRREIGRRFDEIVAFAEVDRFLDTAVKHYSSGMYVRLAFAVAAHLNPEILVVDEVLAVGDARFQKKCLGRMNDVARSGRTVLFVSHHMTLIQALCSRTVLLNGGRVQFIGGSSEAVAAYLQTARNDSTVRRSARRDGAPTITRLEFESASVAHTSEITVSIDIATARAARCALEVRLVDGQNTPIGMGSLGLLDPDRVIALRPGGDTFRCVLSLPRLAQGLYRVTAQLTLPMHGVLDAVGDGIAFEIHPDPLPEAPRPYELRWGHGAIDIPMSVTRCANVIA
jgi:lipopolysaccharide transport system ATP-binding protein